MCLSWGLHETYLSPGRPMYLEAGPTDESRRKYAIEMELSL